MHALIGIYMYICRYICVWGWCLNAYILTYTSMHIGYSGGQTDKHRRHEEYRQTDRKCIRQVKKSVAYLKAFLMSSPCLVFSAERYENNSGRLWRWHGPNCFLCGKSKNNKFYSNLSFKSGLLLWTWLSSNALVVRVYDYDFIDLAYQTSLKWRDSLRLV